MAGRRYRDYPIGFGAIPINAMRVLRAVMLDNWTSTVDMSLLKFACTEATLYHDTVTHVSLYTNTATSYVALALVLSQ